MSVSLATQRVLATEGVFINRGDTKRAQRIFFEFEEEDPALCSSLYFPRLCAQPLWKASRAAHIKS